MMIPNTRRICCYDPQTVHWCVVLSASLFTIVMSYIIRVLFIELKNKKFHFVTIFSTNKALLPATGVHLQLSFHLQIH